MSNSIQQLAVGASLLLVSAAHAQSVGIGTSAPDSRAALEIVSPSNGTGLLIPRLTATQRQAIASPPQGLMVYQTDGTASGGPQTGFWYYAGVPAAWVFLNPASDNLGDGVARGNLNLNGNKLVGGTAALPGTEGLRVDVNGQVGIGLGSIQPNERLQIDGGHQRIGNAPWTSNTTDRQLKFGDGDFVTLGETDGDDLLQFRAREFRLNASSGNGYTGNVGIGLGIAIAPAEKLTVAGNARLLGTGNGLIFPDGTKQTTAAATSVSLTLPYTGTATTSSSVLSITNSGAGIGVRGASTTGQGVVGRVNGIGAGQGVVGVKGTNIPSIEDAGVVGLSEANYGVYARSSQNTGVYGISDGTATNVAGVMGGSNAASGVGVYGFTNGSMGVGVQGTAGTGTGVAGSSTSAAGVQGTSSANLNTTGGVVGINNSGGGAVGVLGTTTSGYGVRGVASADGGWGVSGMATNSYGVRGQSTSGVGTYGSSGSGIGIQGISTSNTGVQGSSSSGSGVVGSTSAGSSAGIAGVVGSSSNSSGIGVLGTTTSGYGVRGEATDSNGYGVIGTAAQTNGIGVYGAASGAATAVYGLNNGTGRTAYFGLNNASNSSTAVEINSTGTGTALLATGNSLTARFVRGGSTNGRAVEISNEATGPALVVGSAGAGGVVAVNNNVNTSLAYPTTGAFAQLSYDQVQVNDGAGSYSLAQPAGTVLQGPGQPTTLSNGSAGPNTVLVVRQTTTTGAGLFATVGTETGRYAGMFRGDIIVTGSVNGALKNFKIDHPLDPENQYLVHTSVESAEQLDLYSGNTTLDAQGEATVQLPTWFEALNQDFRYQLTPIGAAFVPYVREKVHNGRFRIAGQPGAEVSWLLTGTRHDAYARAHPTVVEQPKEPAMRGRYLHPASYGRSDSQGFDYQAGEQAVQPAK